MFFFRAHSHPLDIINKANLVTYGLSPVDDDKGVSWVVVVAVPIVVAPVDPLTLNDIGGPTYVAVASSSLKPPVGRREALEHSVSISRGPAPTLTVTTFAL